MIKVIEIHESFYNEKNEVFKTESREYHKEFVDDVQLDIHRKELERIFRISNNEKKRIQVHFTKQIVSHELNPAVNNYDEPGFISRKPKFKHHEEIKD